METLNLVTETPSKSFHTDLISWFDRGFDMDHLSCFDRGFDMDHLSWFDCGFNTDLFSGDDRSFDTDLLTAYGRSCDTDRTLLDFSSSTYWFSVPSFALKKPKKRLRSDPRNDKGVGHPVHNKQDQVAGYEKRYKFKREPYQTAKFVQMLSEFDDIAYLRAKLMESRKSNHRAKLMESRKRNHCAKLMKSKNLFDDDGQVKRYEFKGEYYQMPKLVRMLSEEFNDKVSLEEHAIRIPNQTSHGGGGQIHNQLAKPNGPPVNSTLPNLTEGAVSTAMNPSPPSQTVNSEGPVEVGTSSSPVTPSGGSDRVSSEGDVELGTFSGGMQTPPGNNNNNSSSSESNNGSGVELHGIENGFISLGTILSAAFSAKKDELEMSWKAKYLWYFVAACVAVGQVCFFYGLCLSVYRKRKAARLVRTVGMVVTAFSILTMAGHLFPKEAMVEGTFVLLAACAVPIILIVWKYYSKPME